jgi:hypothetical protein
MRSSSKLLGILRRNVPLQGRPFGPGGMRIGVEYRRTIPYRSEVTMIRMAKRPVFNSNMRETFKNFIGDNNVKAIPRDLGELTRNFAVRILLLNQPLKLLDWWELCKAQNDCPLDSSKHLREVMKIAKMQNWVYTEKNQTNNLWYYYVHPKRTHEVQRMIRADGELAKERMKQQELALEARASEARDEEEQSLNANIVSLQHLLVANLSRINEFDPDFVRAQPQMTSTGGVNVTWYREPGETVQKQVEAGNQNEPTP